MEARIDLKSSKIGRRGLFGGTWRTLEGQIGVQVPLGVQKAGELKNIEKILFWQGFLVVLQLWRTLGGHLDSAGRAALANLESNWSPSRT